MDQIAALMGQQGGQQQAQGQPDPGMGLPPAPPQQSARDPKIAGIEQSMIRELMARNRRDDLEVPDSMLDTPNRVLFPVLQAPKEETMMPAPPIDFLSGLGPQSSPMGLPAPMGGDPMMGMGVDPMGSDPMMPPPGEEPLF